MDSIGIERAHRVPSGCKTNFVLPRSNSFSNFSSRRIVLHDELNRPERERVLADASRRRYRSSHSSSQGAEKFDLLESKSGGDVRTIEFGDPFDFFFDLAFLRRTLIQCRIDRTKIFVVLIVVIDLFRMLRQVPLSLLTPTATTMKRCYFCTPLLVHFQSILLPPTIISHFDPTASMNDHRTFYERTIGDEERRARPGTLRVHL